MASKRRRISRIDNPNPEAMALHASSVADAKAKRGPTTRAKPWYLLAGTVRPYGSHGSQPVARVYSTLTRMDYFNPKASGKQLSAAPLVWQDGACVGLEGFHVEG